LNFGERSLFHKRMVLEFKQEDLSRP